MNAKKCIDNQNLPRYSFLAGILANFAAIFLFMMLVCQFKKIARNIVLGVVIFFAFAHFGLQCWGIFLIMDNIEYWRDGLQCVECVVCDEKLFLFSFSMIIIYWIILFILVAVFCMKCLA